MVQATSPWYEAYPAPKNAAPIIPRQELLQWIHDGKQAGVDFALIDLRRTDLEVRDTR
jgi:arsenical-resistance protein 2